MFLLHLWALLVLAGRAGRGLFISPFPRIFTGIVLIWSNLVLTAQLASTVGLLGRPEVYFALSLLLQWLAVRGLHWACGELEPAPPAETPGWWDELRASRGSLVLLAGLAVVAAGVLLVAVSVLPNNWDTLAYRFARVMLFLGSGSIGHPAERIDPRILYYPYNGSALYLFLAQYEWTGVVWNLVSSVTWMAGALAVFYVPLSLGAPARAALAGATLFATTPIVLSLANSTNDELIAGAPLVFSILFLVQWLRNGHPAGLALSIAALALSAGTKLHIIFMAPYLLVAGAVCCWWHRNELAGRLGELRGVRLRAPVLAAIVAIPIGGGFVVTNLAATGKLTSSELSQSVLNTPFHAGAAMQTFRLITAQLLLAPLPDHVYPFGRERAAAAYARANEISGRTLFTDVQQGSPYTHTHYRFRGLTPPDAVNFYEQTHWLGLVPWLVGLLLLWAVVHRRRLAAWQWVLLLALPAWHVIFTSFMRYAETVGAYYAYAAPAGMAGFGIAFALAANATDVASRVLRVALAVVLASNFWLAGASLCLSPKRNVQSAFQTGDQEDSVSRTSPTVRSLVAQARRIHIAYNHWELLFWNLMRLNPGARYFTGAVKPEMQPDLMLFPVGSRFAWQMPVPVRAPGIGAYRLGGTMSADEELVFCTGAVCGTATAKQEDFLFLRMHQANGEMAVLGPAEGQLPGQDSFLRFTAFGGKLAAPETSPWVALSRAASFRHRFSSMEFEYLEVEMSCEAGESCLLAKTVLPIVPTRRMLVDAAPERPRPVRAEEVSALFGPQWEGTEGAYWKFIWRPVPGTTRIRSEWRGGGGERVEEELPVVAIGPGGVVVRRPSTNGEYSGKWEGAGNLRLRGTTTWGNGAGWSGWKAR
jgi:hypothetical protein